MLNESNELQKAKRRGEWKKKNIVIAFKIWQGEKKKEKKEGSLSDDNRRC